MEGHEFCWIAADYDQRSSHLLSSKIRVLPLRKRLTIPKLEMAALAVACRLACTLQKGTRFRSVTLWSDSMICIAQVQNPDKQKDVFVANRAHEVHRSNYQVRYVPTGDNPADILSRGVVNHFPLQMCSLWLNGPEWLVAPEDFPSHEVNKIS